MHRRSSGLADKPCAEICRPVDALVFDSPALAPEQHVQSPPGLGRFVAARQVSIKVGKPPNWADPRGFVKVG